MMSNVSEWSVTAGSNNSAVPNGWPEGMARSGVNDAARENMAAVAKWYQDLLGSILSGGTSTAYTVTTNNAHAALNDINHLSFRVHTANGASATLNVDGKGAKSLFYCGAALDASVLAQNSICCVQYNPNQDRFEILSSHTINSASIASGAITTAKYAAGSVDTTALGNLAVTSGKIAALAVTAGKIAADAVTSTEIATDAVGTTEIAANAVTASEIASDAVTTAKILDANVTAGKLATDSVTTIKILADNVTYAKIQNVSATDRLLGRDTAGAGDIEELSVTAPLAFGGGPNLTTSVATDRLLGRDTAGTGAAEEIPVTAPLTFTGGPGLDVSTATTAARGVVELATNTEVQSGTDTARVSPVSSMVRHEGMAKAWGSVIGATGATEDTYNVASVSRTGTGVYTITFTNAMNNDNYVVAVCTGETTAAADHIIRVSDRTTTTFELQTETEDNANVDNDFMFVVFGSLA